MTTRHEAPIRRQRRTSIQGLARARFPPLRSDSPRQPGVVRPFFGVSAAKTDGETSPGDDRGQRPVHSVHREKRRRESAHFCALMQLTQSIVSGPPPQRRLAAAAAAACRPLRNGSSLPRLQRAVRHRSYRGNTAPCIITLCLIVLFFFNVKSLYLIGFSIPSPQMISMGCSLLL